MICLPRVGRGRLDFAVSTVFRTTLGLPAGECRSRLPLGSYWFLHDTQVGKVVLHYCGLRRVARYRLIPVKPAVALSYPSRPSFKTFR